MDSSIPRQKNFPGTRRSTKSKPRCGHRSSAPGPWAWNRRISMRTCTRSMPRRSCSRCCGRWRESTDCPSAWLATQSVFRDLLPYVGAGDPFPDAIFSPLGDVQPSAWKDYYIDVVKHLQPGVSELFVHLAHDDAEMRAVTVNFPVWDAAWRQRDLDVISSPEFRQALVDNHVISLGHRPIQRLVR